MCVGCMLSIGLFFSCLVGLRVRLVGFFVRLTRLFILLAGFRSLETKFAKLIEMRSFFPCYFRGWQTTRFDNRILPNGRRCSNSLAYQFPIFSNLAYLSA